MFRPITACALALLLAAPAMGDEIVLRDGRRITGVEISAETYAKVTYQIAGAPQEERASNVLEIVHESKPLPYRQGEEAMQGGRFAEAAERFTVAASSARDAWVKQYGLFFAGEAYRQANRFPAAAQAYNQLLSDVPDTRFLPQARLGLAQCKLEAGSFDQARSLFAQLQQEAQQKDLGSQWGLAAELGTARAWELQGDKAKAAGLYRSIARKAVTERGIAAAATLGELRTSTDGRRALNGLESLIDASETPDDVRAEAYVEQGRRQAAAGEHKKALLSFLRVCYDPTFRGFAAARAEALFRGAEAFEKAQTEEAQVRASALRRELKESFPDSSWARQ
jgi:tetratricopeptide (TPR) repeat protein